MEDFEKTLVNLAQSAINGMGTIAVPIQTESGILSVGIDPKVDFSKLDLHAFNIGQIKISDSSIVMGFSGKMPENMSLNFSIDSQLGTFIKDDSSDKTTISMNMAGTSINNNVFASVAINDTVMNIFSPSGTNNFSATFTLKAKL